MKVDKLALILVETLFLLTGLGSLVAIIILAATKDVTLFWPNIGVLFIVTAICWMVASILGPSDSKESQDDKDTDTTVP